MALLDVVFRLLNKAGDDFVEPRREDGHGSTISNPTHVSLNGTQQVAVQGEVEVKNTVGADFPVVVDNFPAVQTVDGTVTITQAQIDSITTILTRIDQNTDTLELTADNIALNADQINLNTDTLEQGQADILSRLNLTLNVADDYQTGEILPDQTGANNVLTFTFANPVQNVWVYAVNPLDLAEAGEVRVDPFGGNPSATRGIPVGYGGITPIPTTTGSLKVFAPLGARVTVYGNRRA